jgi:hypothetical protein
MSTSVDFKIISNTAVSGIALVYAMNESAYNYLCDEDISVMDNGAAPIDTDIVGDFISDAGWAHLDTELV